MSPCPRNLKLFQENWRRLCVLTGFDCDELVTEKEVNSKFLGNSALCSENIEEG